MAKVIMVQGTMSGAGKSMLTAGLLRVFLQDGYSCAPFKSQNMALNSYITKEGLEMGRAQVMQAEAAGIEPSVCMNPILLKPTTDVGSQVIVNGEVLGNMKARDYFAYKKQLIPDILKAYQNLAEQYDIIVIEGAGSPAEINLKENDIVNMGMARLVDAPVLLVGDIDRGGVFAQLVGTYVLLEEEERARIRGFVLNKFRGDKSILEPGCRMLEERCHVPVTGVLPYLSLDLEDEDSLSERLTGTDALSAGGLKIVVVRLPRISNFTDFNPLSSAGVEVVYTDRAGELSGADCIILPGSKNTLADLEFVRKRGLERALREAAEAGVPVVGICGGYQMLGERILDPEGVEGERKEAEGLGLLPCVTVMQPEKAMCQKTGTVGRVTELWEGLSGIKISGYEIHMGETKTAGEAPEGVLQSAGSVFGTYFHGLFENDRFRERFLDILWERRKKKNGKEQAGDGFRKYSFAEHKEQEYNRLAQAVRENLDMEQIYRILSEQ